MLARDTAAVEANGPIEIARRANEWWSKAIVDLRVTGLGAGSQVSSDR